MQMQQNTVISKILLTLLVFGTILWLGGEVQRINIAYEIYMPFTKMELKTEYSDAIRMHTVKLFTYGSLYSGIGFVATFIGFVTLAFHWRKQWKTKGWMFIVLVLFIIALPWGFYELLLDIKLSFLIKAGAVYFNDKQITDLFVKRFTDYAPWASISYLSIVSGIIILIWRPLNNIKKINKEEENEIK